MNHLFSNRDLKRLLFPIVIEQLLNSLMGTADTIMVSNIGSEAISAVSLVDSINVLMIQAFAALAAGGTIVCSHYVGSRKMKEANHSAQQLLLTVTVLSMAIMGICQLLRNPLLSLIFGQIEEAVMVNARIYFFYTALSFPFIAMYNAGAAIFRAQENTRLPMMISVASNFLNIGGNAILIWGFRMGVAGAAIPTLVSRIFCAVVVLACLRRSNCQIQVRDYHRIRPDFPAIRKILSIGIPSGVENSMFQLGKLAVQSTVSTLGTTAIAAQAMTNILEGLNGVPGMGIGIGLMTVVGECLGAGRQDEAVYYIKKLSLVAEVAVAASCFLVLALTKPITWIGGMEPASASLCFQMVVAITLVKPLLWVLSFVPGYGMRAAGDVRFSMILSCASMWTFRVVTCIILCRYLGFGPMGVWIAMFLDWGFRALCYSLRFRSRRWLLHKVIDKE